jgi:multicomponent Na+:H+ antiporter subunit D
MVAGMNGVALSGDMFNLFVFLEVSAIASYALVAFGVESEELEASFKYLILGGLASSFILFGVGILYNLTGTLNMAQVSDALSRQAAESGHLNRAALLAAAFFLMGFGLKAAMVPFHAWLPDAHPSAPAPMSAMLSGVVIKTLGIYALCRVLFNVLGVGGPLPEGLYIAQVLVALGVLSMVVGGLLMVGQWDLKRLLAYSSISQMGYVILAMGVGGEMLRDPAKHGIAELAIFGGLFHLFNHAMFKSLLFLCSGAIEYGTGTRQLRQMGGLGQKMPVTGGCCRIAALSISGVPPFNGFWSKLTIIVAVVWAGHYVLGSIAVLVAFMTLLTYIKVQRYVLHGELPTRLQDLREAPGLMCFAMVALAVLCCISGVLVGLFLSDQLLDPGMRALTRGAGYVRMVLGSSP